MAVAERGEVASIAVLESAVHETSVISRLERVRIMSGHGGWGRSEQGLRDRVRKGDDGGPSCQVPDTRICKKKKKVSVSILPPGAHDCVRLCVCGRLAVKGWVHTGPGTGFTRWYTRLGGLCRAALMPIVCDARRSPSQLTRKFRVSVGWDGTGDGGGLRAGRRRKESFWMVDCT